MNVCYDGRGRVCFKSARFVDQIAIEDGDFSKGGDSGSLIVTNDEDNNNNPVGLLFAGSSTRTFANRIDLVLARFNVTIDDAAPAPVADVTDVAVTAVSAPGSVVKDDVVSVDVTVENVGNQNVTDDITVTLTDTPPAEGAVGTVSEPVIIGGLEAGASAIFTFTWKTEKASLGDHVLTASHNFAVGDTSNDSKSATVTVNEPPPPGEGVVIVDDIDPSLMDAGASIEVTISGSGFAAEAVVTFENGSGPTPTASIDVVSSDGKTITATVTVKGGGRRGNRVWDVRVTNVDGSSGVLPDGFTVIRR